MKILVDSPQIIVKSATSNPAFAKAASHVLEIGNDAVITNMQKTMEDISSIVSKIKQSTDKCKIKEAKFTLTFGATGEVALLSVIKGGLEATAGIEFTISFE